MLATSGPSWLKKKSVAKNKGRSVSVKYVNYLFDFLQAGILG